MKTDQAAAFLERYNFWFKPQRGQKESHAALVDVSFKVQVGSFVLILGRSGSGKSTLALNLVGIYPDYFGGRNDGRILINHPKLGLVNRRDITADQRFRIVNMLFQNPEDQIVTLTVEDEVGFALENYQYEPTEIRRRIDLALDMVGLDGFQGRETLHLSGGEKQRVGLAAMLAMEPSVLILDEPTSNLDPAGTADVLDTIDRIRKRLNLTVLVIEHEVDEVFARVDAVLLVEDRHVIGPFEPRQFIEERGLQVRDQMGLWIPQASEVGLLLREQGNKLPGGIPLNGAELVEAVESLDMKISPQKPPGKGVDADYPRPRSSNPAIELREVSFNYAEQSVLKNLNLLAHKNELLAIVGQNGSGKSTLASLCNGIEQPDLGTVFVDGIPTGDYSFEKLVRRVAYIFQVPEKQFVCGTVYDEIAHGLRTLGIEKDEVDQQTVKLLDTVRLLDRRNASPYVLSHGQKRRLSVAAMVVSKPKVVILDEPTFGQDYQQAQNLMRMLRDLADEGASVIFITHDMRLVAEYADRAAVLCDGKIIFDGQPEELFVAEEILLRARLKPPSVAQFSVQLLGHPVLTTQALVERIQGASGG